MTRWPGSLNAMQIAGTGMLEATGPAPTPKTHTAHCSFTPQQGFNGRTMTAGLWYRQENYNSPVHYIDANSYLRLNEALDTPRVKHFPKHLLFLRDFTKNPSGAVCMIATPHFTGSGGEKKTTSNFANKSWGMGKGLGEGLVLASL